MRVPAAKRRNTILNSVFPRHSSLDLGCTSAASAALSGSGKGGGSTPSSNGPLTACAEGRIHWAEGALAAAGGPRARRRRPRARATCFFAMPRADVPRQLAALCRSVATALRLAGVRALARVRPYMRIQVAALCRSVATALHLAGVRALARVRPHVRGKVIALCRRVATALLLARERALAHLEARALQSAAARRGEKSPWWGTSAHGEGPPRK